MSLAEFISNLSMPEHSASASPPVHRWIEAGFENILVWSRKLDERKHAIQMSAEILKLYYSARSVHPSMNSMGLFKLIVMAQTACSDSEAENVLRSAQESFAEWPSSRELTLCDVVHYLSADQFQRLHPSQSGIYSDMAAIVQQHMPLELCRKC